MKTTTTTKQLALTVGALFAFGICANAQNNVSLDTDNIPVPGGSENVVTGKGSMLSNSGGANATYGNYALQANTSGDANTAGGYGALNGNQTGGFNSSIGVKSMTQNDNGNYNSALGAYAMNANIKGDCNTSVGSFADLAAGNLVNATSIGCSAIAYNNDQVWLGDANATVWTINSYNLSDGRFKRNVDENSVKGLDFINRLRPVTYNFDAKSFTEFITKDMPEATRKHYLEKDFSKRFNMVQTGFIAQEVADAAKASGYNFSGVHTPDGAHDTYGVSYYQLVVPLVKAVQEQQKMIDELKRLLVAQNNTNNGVGNTSGINTIKGADGFVLNQNEPNPFTHETVIRYTMPQNVNSAYVAIYDLSGKQITTFGLNDRGTSSITITSEKLAAGIYIYSVVADGKILDSKRMVVSEK